MLEVIHPMKIAGRKTHTGNVRQKTRQNQTNHISNHLDILAPTKLNAQGSAVQVCLSALQFGQPKRPPRRFDRYSPSLREPHEPHNPRATHFHIPMPLTVWFPRLSYKSLWPSSCCRRSRNVCHAYHPCYWQNLLQNHHRHPKNLMSLKMLQVQRQINYTPIGVPQTRSARTWKTSWTQSIQIHSAWSLTLHESTTYHGFNQIVCKWRWPHHLKLRCIYKDINILSNSTAWFLLRPGMPCSSLSNLSLKFSIQRFSHCDHCACHCQHFILPVQLIKKDSYMERQILA